MIINQHRKEPKLQTVAMNSLNLLDSGRFTEWNVFVSLLLRVEVTDVFLQSCYIMLLHKCYSAT